MTENQAMPEERLYQWPWVGTVQGETLSDALRELAILLMPSPATAALSQAASEIDRLRAEISKRDRLNKDVIGELNDMRAENERLRHVLERIRDSECGVEAGRGDWCGGSIERGRIHDKDCPARWALAALNPEPTS